MLRSDACAPLRFLREPHMLDNLRARYARDAVYTYTAHILIACNPFKRLSIYGEERMAQYQGKVASLHCAGIGVADGPCGAPGLAAGGACGRKRAHAAPHTRAATAASLRPPTPVCVRVAHAFVCVATVSRPDGASCLCSGRPRLPFNEALWPLAGSAHLG